MKNLLAIGLVAAVLSLAACSNSGKSTTTPAKGGATAGQTGTGGSTTGGEQKKQ